jgi:hypothetical protein
MEMLIVAKKETIIVKASPPQLMYFHNKSMEMEPLKYLHTSFRNVVARSLSFIFLLLNDWPLFWHKKL